MRLASIFQNHAVLQRDLPIPVWGTAGGDEQVTVTLAGHQARVISNPDGRWLLRLPALPAGGPFELAAESASGRVVVHDLLIGEVWICSGQSNMEWKAPRAELVNDADTGGDFPAIRMLSVDNRLRRGSQEDFEGRWAVCTPELLMKFSAVGGWFGRTLHRELGVPVGLICNARGGSRIQSWISRESLVRDPVGLDEIRCYDGFVYDAGLQPPIEFASFDEWERKGAPQDAGNRGFKEGWGKPDFDDSSWAVMAMPSCWQEHGHPGSGVFWFRRTVAVPETWAGRELELRLGSIDKHDDTYVNGERVGGLSMDDGPQTWCTPRIYTVPGRLVPAGGELTIAVRVRSHVYNGGMRGPGLEMRVAPANAPASSPVPLDGNWRYAIEQDWGVVMFPGGTWGPGNHNSPSMLFESRVAPLVPYSIRGVIWYQGESNASEALIYRRLLPLMIRDWRHLWGQGDFPFLQVQLANFGSAAVEPGRSQWAELRDAQATALSEPNTGMVVAIDVGEANDLHPPDKRSVGLRLARWALAETYFRGGEPSGPLYAGSTIGPGGSMRIHFRHGAGLATRDGNPVRHLAIAGTDRNFVTAESRIDGETLVAWHPQVSRPAAARYAWADNPEGCNLINAAGLPASPFRTDAWGG